MRKTIPVVLALLLVAAVLIGLGVTQIPRSQATAVVREAGNALAAGDTDRLLTCLDLKAASRAETLLDGALWLGDGVETAINRLSDLLSQLVSESGGPSWEAPFPGDLDRDKLLALLGSQFADPDTAWRMTTVEKLSEQRYSIRLNCYSNRDRGGQPTNTARITVGYSPEARRYVIQDIQDDNGDLLLLRVLFL